MQRKPNRNRHSRSRVDEGRSRSTVIEAVEMRLLFAFPQATVVNGAANPFDGIDIGYQSGPALADVDGDGNLDLVVGSDGGGVRYWKNTGSAINPVYVEQTGANNPFGVAGAIDGKPTLGDLDGDGDLDLVIGEVGGRTFYYKNTGTKTNPVYVQQTGAANPVSGVDPGFDCDPALGDMDGDGDLDLVVGGRDYSGLQYWKNTGTATNPVFTEQTGAANPFGGMTGYDRAPVLADADGDGDLDVFMGDAINSTVRFFRNTGNVSSPAFPQATGELSVFSFPAPAVGDVDGDGDLDFLVGGNWGGLSYFRGDVPPPTISYTQRTGAANPFNGFDVGDYSTPALGDLDGDGDLDAVVGGYDGTVKYFRNVGSATSPSYAQQTGANNPFNALSGFSLGAPALADVDGDGDLDLVMGQNGGTLAYFKNTGTAISPTFTQQTGAANPFNAIAAGNRSAPALADIDGDGDLDLAVGWLGGNVYYYKNTGTATSPIYVQQTGAANPFNGFAVDFYSTPTFGDVDGDGDLDAIVGGQSRTLYLKNTGTITSPAYALQSGAGDPFSSVVTNSFSAPALADVDGDGDLDAVVGIADGTLTYLRKNRSPVAVNDFYTMNQDTSLTANGTGGNPPGVLDNDLAIEGGSMTAAPVSTTANGGKVLFSNGTFFYTPAAGYSGTDSFTYRTSANGLDSSVATVTINVMDTVAPTVQASQFNFETGPQNLTVKFSENVSASLSPSDFQVTSVPSSTSVPFTLSYDSLTNMAMLAFSSILASSDYHLTILAPDVTDATGNALAADHNLDFFFMNADASRNRTVDTIDFNLLAANFSKTGQTFSQGNFNYDAAGNVDTVDFNLLAANFSKSLAASQSSTLRAPVPQPAAELAGAPSGVFADMPLEKDQSLLAEVLL